MWERDLSTPCALHPTRGERECKRAARRTFHTWVRGLTPYNQRFRLYNFVSPPSSMLFGCELYNADTRTVYTSFSSETKYRQSNTGELLRTFNERFLISSFLQVQRTFDIL